MALPEKVNSACALTTELLKVGPDIMGQPYNISILKEGYCLPQPNGSTRADGTISLLQGPKIILVDTGGPWDRDFLLVRLKEKSIDPDDINIVVGTHGHSDHVGNLGLFPGATMVVGCDISQGDLYLPNKLAEGEPYPIDEHVLQRVMEDSGLRGKPIYNYDESRFQMDKSRQKIITSRGSKHAYVQAPGTRDHLSLLVCFNTAGEPVSILPTPGHTGRDVSVLVKGTSVGTVLVAGDLFECCTDGDTWRELSENPAVQEVNRQKALQTANVIIPGHGGPFRVCMDVGGR